MSQKNLIITSIARRGTVSVLSQTLTFYSQQSIIVYPLRPLIFVTSLLEHNLAVSKYLIDNYPAKKLQVNQSVVSMLLLM